MKRLLLFSFLFFNTVIFAQWFWQNPLPQGNPLLSIYFISSDVGWAVGSNGTSSYFKSVYFTDLSNGCIK